MKEGQEMIDLVARNFSRKYIVKSSYSIEYNYLFILFNFVTWQGIFITFEHVKNIGND